LSPILGIWASQNYPRITNSYESIATVTVGSGGQAAGSFTSIPSTFKHLQIRVLAKTNSNGNIKITFNGDTTGNYNTHVLYGTGSAAGAGVTGLSDTGIFGVDQYWGTNSIYFTGAVIDVLDYQNTNKYKVTRTLGGNNTNGGNEDICLISGLWRSTSAITQIDLTGSSNISQYSSFALYGIRG